jgi:dynein intermediate chain
MRCKERPVQRSSMSRQRGHSHPIVSMSMAGMSPESREMMSVCTGGTVCTWDVSRMNEPVTSMMISLPTNEATLFSQTNTLDSLRVSSCAYAYEGDRDAFHSIILGNEIGRLYSINMPYRQIDPVIQISAHQGLITSIDMHPSRLPCYKNLFLTSSFDCSVKLWNLEVHDKPIVEINSSSFDYIVDVKWSPIGPSIFGMITSAGQLQIWDLSTSTTCPHDSIQLLHDTAGEEGNNRKLEALNKMKWSLDGRQIMVGGSRGAVFAVLIAIEAARSRPENIESFKKLIDPLPT